MVVQFCVRILDQSDWSVILIDLDLFIPYKELEEEIFGFYKGVKISILKETRDVIKEGN